MFDSKKTKVNAGRSYKYILFQEDQQIRYINFLSLLQQDEAFRSFFIELLSEIRFGAYQWETPPVTFDTLGQPFEFVATRNTGIDLPPDPGPFRQYFNSNEKVAVFDNLGGDAKLIAPTPNPKLQKLNYSHIGTFTKDAPLEQQHALWQRVGQVTEGQISDQPIWLNTAGGGVAWLHIRLDSSPKYYRHQPYMAVN